jgi:hypothetical protein
MKSRIYQGLTVLAIVLICSPFANAQQDQKPPMSAEEINEQQERESNMTPADRAKQAAREKKAFLKRDGKTEAQIRAEEEEIQLENKNRNKIDAAAEEKVKQDREASEFLKEAQRKVDNPSDNVGQDILKKTQKSSEMEAKAKKSKLQSLSKLQKEELKQKVEKSGGVAMVKQKATKNLSFAESELNLCESKIGACMIKIADAKERLESKKIKGLINEKQYNEALVKISLAEERVGQARLKVEAVKAAQTSLISAVNR